MVAVFSRNIWWKTTPLSSGCLCSCKDPRDLTTWMRLLRRKRFKVNNNTTEFAQIILNMEDQLTVILITRSFWRAKIGKCQILILNSERKKKQLILWTLRRNWYGLSLYYFSGKRRPLLHPNTAQRSFFHYDLQGHRTTVFFKISVRRSKFCLEFSITWEQLEISR